MTEGNQVILKEIDRRFEEAVKSLTDTPDKLSSTTSMTWSRTT